MSDDQTQGSTPQDAPPPLDQPGTFAAPHQQHHTAESGQDASPHPEGHGGHRLMMIVCCIPMLVIAAILVATGVAGAGAILVALLCTAMMAAMMFSMPGGHRH